MRADGGAAGFVDIVARLLTVTFAGQGHGSEAAGGEAHVRGPFPGTT